MMVTRKSLPREDLMKFKERVLKGIPLTKDPEGRKIFNRLCHYFGSISTVYTILGLPQKRKKNPTITVEEAEKLLVEFFEGGGKSIRKFAEKFPVAARNLHRKYRFLSDAVLFLIPDTYVKGRILITRKELERKMTETVKKVGYVLVGEDIVPPNRKGALPRGYQEAARKLFGSTISAAQHLNLPYRIYQHGLDETVEEILTILREFRDNGITVHQAIKKFGMTKAIRAYRLLRKLGRGNYLKGCEKLRQMSSEKVRKFVQENTHLPIQSKEG